MCNNNYMQLLPSEEITAATTDQTARYLLENTIAQRLAIRQKHSRFIVEFNYQRTTSANLNPEVWQQLVTYLSQIEYQLWSGRLYERKREPQLGEGIQIKVTLNTPKIDKYTNLENQGLKIVRERLVALLQEEDEDDYGISKPTPYAFDTVWNLVSEVSELMGNSFPKASASTDDEGGIRLTWNRLEPEREIRLICPSTPSKQTYLYHESGENYGIVDDVTALTLASWLHWVNEA